MTFDLGFPGRFPPPAPRGTGRPGHVLMAAALLVVTVGLASACGSAGPTSAPPGQAQPARAGVAAASMASPLVTHALDWYFPATAAQYAVGAHYQGEMISLASRLIAACMARSGFRAPVDSAAAAASKIWNLSQFPDFVTMHRTGLMAPDPRPGASAPAPAPMAPSRAYSASASRCQSTAIAPFAHLESTAAHLTTPWIETFTGIQTSPRVQPALSGFAACVERAGAPSTSSQDFNRFAVWAAGQIQGTTDYADSLAADRRWGSVFTRCGQATEALFEKLQTAARAAFFREHAHQVRALASLVTTTVNDARHLLAQPGPAASARGRPSVSPS